ncbi:MAG: hypothetical protein QF886_21025, partial [Planctomycetota bacterium]|nr:hypothetical protein [Planctomycetota bacterium]
THAARQLVDASISTTAQPDEADGKVYTIGGLILEYAQDHPAHIAPEELQGMAEEAISEACRNQHLDSEILSTQAFKPARPEPIHRMSL